MKRNKRNLFLFGMSILMCGTFLSASAYAEEYYVTQEPTVTINQEAKTAQVTIVVENPKSGISSFRASSGYTRGEITQMNVHMGGGDCYADDISCEQQQLAPATISLTENNLESGTTYFVSDVSITDSNRQTINIDGRIEYTLDEGVTVNTFKVRPSMDERLERTNFIGAPVIKYDDEGRATVSITIQNEVDGIKSVRLYVNSVQQTAHSIMSVRKDAAHDCAGKTDEECLEIEKTPLTITFNPDDYSLEDDAPTINSFIIEFSDGAIVIVEGYMTLDNSDEGFNSTIALATVLARATGINGEGNVKNPQTADPIVGLAAIIGAATLVGVFGLKRQARR